AAEAPSRACETRAPAAGATSSQTSVPSPPSAPRPPVSARLDALNLSPLGGEATLRLSVASQIDEPNAEVFFDLPPAMVAVNGPLRQPIGLEAGVPQSFDLVVELAETGEHRVIGG